MNVEKKNNVTINEKMKMNIISHRTWRVRAIRASAARTPASTIIVDNQPRAPRIAFTGRPTQGLVAGRRTFLASSPNF